ncbi:MAG: ABC transporter substrate-binding protein [Candidatus Rokuibacteriota bacterium]
MPAADLKILDPIWTTSTITRNHGYLVYDTLFATDASFQVRPQMVDRYRVSNDGLKYSFTLRDGLRFHDGQPVTAEDCVVSLQRWGKKDVLGRLMSAATGKLQAVDRKTFVLELSEPFGMVLEALGKPSSSVPFIMPARLAATSENEQIKEVVGSGPFRFAKDEWQPGHQVVYVRNPDYSPRNEAPNGLAGGKPVYLDRVVWRYIPDAATVGAALEAGEVDYWENPPLDFVPRLSRNQNLVVFVADPRGTQGWLRPNHLHPPFDNKKARQALLWVVNQETYLQAVIGQAKYYRTCPAYFMCGTPYESAAGMPTGPNLERARQLMNEAGYDGRPVVILDPSDLSVLHGASLVTRELLTQIGVNVDLQAMDWSTLVARRAKKEPPKEGGWNILHTYFFSWDSMTPAVNPGISGACDKAWFGWYCSEQMEKLRREWVRTNDAARRKQLAEQIQVLAADEVPYVPWGQWLQPDAYRRNVRGLIQFGIHVFWNIAVDA